VLKVAGVDFPRKNTVRWYIDGTFKIKDKSFTHLFSIHGFHIKTATYNRSHFAMSSCPDGQRETKGKYLKKLLILLDHVM
jgi:hypothetical protein